MVSDIMGSKMKGPALKTVNTLLEICLHCERGKVMRKKNQQPKTKRVQLGNLRIGGEVEHLSNVL